MWGTNWNYICYIEESRPSLWSSGQSSWLQNADVLCFLWGTNWIYVCCIEEGRPRLWSSGQSSWLQNGDVLCFLWSTNRIYEYICYVEERRPPLCSSGQSSWLQNRDVLCFLWDMNWIYVLVYYVEITRPPLWSGGQSSWLQNHVSRIDSRRYQTFWEVVGLEWGPLSLVSITEKLIGRNSSGSDLESRECGRSNQLRWPSNTLYEQTLALTSPTSGGRSVCTVRSRTKTLGENWYSFLLKAGSTSGPEYFLKH
jgi:hypothetical protein